MPILGITGLPGAGKTLFAVRAMYRLRQRRPRRWIVSNFPLYLPGMPVEMVDCIDDCYELSECDLVLDELHLWLSNRDWQKHSGGVGAWLSQLRKRDVNLWYTTQDIGSVDKFVRDRTFLTYYLESFKLLGFFWWRCFFGTKADHKKRCNSGWYLFSETIARCYQTEYIVKL